jgi:hypothetical protein
MFRLYVDEVGHDDLGDLTNDDNRYLSLTGVAMRIEAARDDLTPKLDWIKGAIFGDDPDTPVILHRRKIVQKKGIFGVLNNPQKLDLFNRAILKVFRQCDYRVITAVIDKLDASQKERWREKHPYHYLMQILTEKFARFLVRMNSHGDIMPEGRMGKKDQRLQEAYDAVRRNGNYYFAPEQICYRIPSDNLKFRYKTDNIAGLQIADLLAHPSHMYVRSTKGHNIRNGKFASLVKDILVETKYDRSDVGTIRGYGIKYLP